MKEILDTLIREVELSTLGAQESLLELCCADTIETGKESRESSVAQ